MLNVHIRWMIRRDMAPTLAIERESFARPWTETDFVTHLRNRNTIGMVAECGDELAGYMLYELHHTHLALLNLAVHHDARRQGVGTQMLDKLAGKLSERRRTHIALMVCETNLDAQLFFRQFGFVAKHVIRQPYGNCDDDAYYMEYRHGTRGPTPVRREPLIDIARLLRERGRGMITRS